MWTRRPTLKKKSYSTWKGQGRWLTLEAPVDLEVLGNKAQGVLTLREGEEVAFVLSYGDNTTKEETDRLALHQRIRHTLEYWENQALEVDYQGPWRSWVVRSYLVLHLLTYRVTGGIIAAPTTSLPEEIGGVRNWDYRYTWLRDAAFTIDAFMSLRHHDDAIAFFQWLGRVCDRACGKPGGGSKSYTGWMGRRT